MSYPKTIEGTWEEILEHSDELAGHYVRVLVLQRDRQPQSLAETLKGKIGILELDTPPELHQRIGEAFTDILEEKRKNKGLGPQTASDSRSLQQNDKGR